MGTQTKHTADISGKEDVAVRTYTFRCSRIDRATRARLSACLKYLSWLGREVVDLQQRRYKEGKPYLSYQDMCKVLTKERQRSKSLSQWSVRVQRSVLERKHQAFVRFFEKLSGFPKKYKHVRSFAVSTKPRRVGKNRYSVQVKGVGKFYFVDKSGRLDSGVRIRLVRVCTHNLGTGVDIQVVVDVAGPAVKDTREPIGIDLGVKTTAMLSNGHRCPKLDLDHTRYKRRQRKLSKARKGSKSRAKKKRAAAKEAQRIKQSRRSQIHALTTEIIKKYSATIVLETLQLEAMTRHGGAFKRGLNREMRSNGLGEFTRQLIYKAQQAGGVVIFVLAAYTTQTCSACGLRSEEKIGLSVRIYRCRFCGHTQDRDLNAARNILFKAFPVLAGREALCAGKDTYEVGEDQGEAATSIKECGGAPGTEQDRMPGLAKAND